VTTWLHEQWLAACEWFDGPRGTPALVILAIMAVALIALERRAGKRARP
jgi:hypothetical protein